MKRLVQNPDGSPRLGLLLALVAVVTFVFIWRSVILGHRALLGWDLVAASALPWQSMPGAHPIQNVLVGDPILQNLAWLEAVGRAFHHGQLPLWDPYALSGSPLLANDQSAPFSPFTILALLFPAVHGISIAELAKMCVGGVGMAVFLRQLGAGGVARVAGGAAFACSSYMVVWLGWQHSAVDALMPWVFASVEWYLRSQRVLAWVSVAVTVCLQFLAGHAETSLFVCSGLALYSLTCWILGDRRLSSLAGLVFAGGLGTAISGIQILPFVSDLKQSTVGADRAAASNGTYHLTPHDLITWLIPNVHGNPAIDHRIGPIPNYNESVGFAGVGMLVMSLPGVLWTWRRERASVAALIVTGLFGAAMAYGPLTPLLGRLPALDTSDNWRYWMLLCFVIPALGGLGVDALATRAFKGRLPSVAGAGLVALGSLALCALVAGALLVHRIHGQVAALLPELPHNVETFWVLMAGAALLTALSFLIAGSLGGRGRSAAVGLCLLAMVEAALFSYSYEPQVPAKQIAPPTALTTWLQLHSQGRPIAAIGNVLPPNTSTLYGIEDVRDYDIVRSTRSRLYWSAADPGYTDFAWATVLNRPRADWLAAAGVAYMLSPANVRVPSTRLVTTLSGVNVQAVPHAQPFAIADTRWTGASGPQAAVSKMARAPLGPPVVEGVPSTPSGTRGRAQVTVLSRSPSAIRLRVRSSSQAAVLIHDSYSEGWSARVDGRSLRVHPAQVEFQSVLVPAGTHTVVFSYQPSSVKLGAALSGIGLILLIVLALAGWRWRIRARGGSAALP